MRKIILSMQLSLDGFIEGPAGDMSWFQKDDQAQWQGLFEMLSSVDLLLLGGGMWKDYRNYWQQVAGNDNASANHHAYAQWAQKTRHIVFSSSLPEAGWANASICTDPVIEEVRKLQLAPGKDIQVVGGAKLAATLLEAGLVDEYRLTINPVLLGGGKSFFRKQQCKVSLQLVNCTSLPSGVVILRYRKS